MRAQIAAAGLLLALAVSSCGTTREDPTCFRDLPREGGEGRPRPLVLTFFDAVMGDAILIEFPSGRTLLVDAGVGWRTDRILRGMAARGISRLDGLLLTHPHPDHYGGMEEIVKAVEVGTFYWNGVRPDRAAYRRLEAALEARAVPRRVLARGDRLDDLAGPGVSLEVLYPDRAAMAAGGSQNRRTMVLRLTHGSIRILLPGDAERPEEKRLLDLDRGALAADVLKLGHHASPGSGSEEYLRAVHPRVAIAQGTAVPDLPIVYPRPNYRIRRVLREEGAVLVTTRREGTVQVISDGNTLRARSRPHPDLVPPVSGGIHGGR